MRSLPSGVIVRRATEADMISLGPRLRVEDKAESFASTGLDPINALLASLRLSSVCHVVTEDRSPVCVFGCADHPVDANTGVPWMMATPDILRYAKSLLVHSGTIVEAMNQRWPLLTNFTDARNIVHHRWLRRLGFTFIARHEQYGHAMIPFYEFVRLNPHV